MSRSETDRDATPVGCEIFVAEHAIAQKWVVGTKLFCRLCRSDLASPVGRIPDRDGIARAVYQCGECYSLTPDFSEAERADCLRDQVSFHEMLWQSSTEFELSHDLQQLIETVHHIGGTLGEPSPERRVLELGAGRGGLLKALRLAGYDAFGCEPASALVETARTYYQLGEDVLSNTDIAGYLDTIDENVRFSSIILWHVLEHLENPVELLVRAAQFLHDDGAIIMQLPLLIEAYTFKEHYFFLSHKSFYWLAEKLGMSVLNTTYDEENMFVMVAFGYREAPSCDNFLDYYFVPDPLFQIAILTQRSRNAYRSVNEHLLQEKRNILLRIAASKSQKFYSVVRSECNEHASTTENGGNMINDLINEVDLRIRSEKFIGRPHNRYWWYNLEDSHYIPPVFRVLSESEWAVMVGWFEDTEKRFSSPGELGIPGVTFLSGLVGGNGVSRIVQCGHYAGYSSLLLGFLLRSMKKEHALFSVDIDPEITAYTAKWLTLAGLDSIVKLTISDSADEAIPAQAREWLGGSPQIVFIDSSHQYEHTLRELERWYDHVEPGGFIVMHDVSVFAQQFDPTGRGGVLSAAQEWAAGKGLTALLINDFVDGTGDPNGLIYKDGCGLGLIQKPR